MTRGEVWWAVGAAGGRRPYLVLTRSRAIDALHSVHAVPATRTIRGIPTQVELDRSDGLPEACALSLDHMTLLAKERLTERICTLGENRMRDVCRALRHTVDC